MTRNRSIRTRLLFDQVLLILLLGGTLMATTFIGARRAFETLSSTLIERAGDQAEIELQRFFDPIAAVIGGLRSWDQSGLLPAAEGLATRTALLPMIDSLPQISGIALADEGGAGLSFVRVEDGWRTRSTIADESGLSSVWLDAADDTQGTDYDPRTRPWFLGATSVEPGSIFWTEPYIFFTSQNPGMTASVAYEVADEGRRVAGVDVDLADLADYARRIDVSPGGGLWILTWNRRLLAWPESAEIWGDRDPESALLQRPVELGLPLIDDSMVAVLERRSDVAGAPIRFASGGEDWWVAGRRFALTDSRSLMIVVTVPHADLLGDRANIRYWILALTALALVAAVLRALVLARRFSTPIEALARQSDRISQGDLEAAEPISAGVAEVQQLADSHERMRKGLETLLKLEGDLQVARQIQQKTFPTELPSLAGFDVVGWSQPADETGGDSYDVIGIDANGAPTQGEAERLILMLADATGHGIGPALSVTQLRAMLRMAIRNGSSLEQTAAHLNEQLYADLPQGRFITAWLGELGPDGTLATFSGGQAPLLVYRAASGETKALNASATPLGLLPPMPVVLPPATQLAPGDIYVVLSDGFFEATNDHGEEFDKKGVIEVLAAYASRASSEILEALRDALREFTNDAPLDDDRTAVIIKRKP